MTPGPHLHADAPAGPVLVCGDPDGIAVELFAPVTA
jgi:hypothetical protein